MFIFNGHDFETLAQIRVAEEVGLEQSFDTNEILGRAGEIVENTHVKPRVFKAYLHLDLVAISEAGLSISEAKSKISEWLFAPDGADFSLERMHKGALQKVTYCDTRCTGVSSWGNVYAGSWAEVELKAFNVIGYGDEVCAADLDCADEVSVAVGGNAPTLGTFTLVPVANASSLSVVCGDSTLSIAGSFSASDSVVIDCLAETVTCNGTDITSSVSLSSTYFPLVAGENTLSISGASTCSVSYTERWL